MRLTVRFLGLDLLDIDLSTEPTAPELEDDYDPATVLSGGTLGAYPIDAGPTDWHMGFTNGRESGDDD